VLLGRLALVQGNFDPWGANDSSRIACRIFQSHVRKGPRHAALGASPVATVDFSYVQLKNSTGDPGRLLRELGSRFSRVGCTARTGVRTLDLEV
jgi:hypothetical protein